MSQGAPKAKIAETYSKLNPEKTATNAVVNKPAAPMNEQQAIIEATKALMQRKSSTNSAAAGKAAVAPSQAQK